MKPSEELKAYIEAEIIPRYGAFDAAHRTCLLYTSDAADD